MLYHNLKLKHNNVVIKISRLDIAIMLCKNSSLNVIKLAKPQTYTQK